MQVEAITAAHATLTFTEDEVRLVNNALNEALERRTHYPWPGNVRELRNFVTRLVALGPEEALSALQFVANRVVNRPGRQRRHVIIDAEGYRARREEALASMARRLGKQAVEEGKIITFEPMSPQDRRIVHLALAKFGGVVTKSDGEGEQRRVQIIPVRR